MYDILIIGAGTAGMVCAITAAQNGKKVGVLEKAAHIGGTLNWTDGYLSAGGTELQKAKGIKDSPAQHYQDIIRINGKTGDLNLIKKAVEEAPKTVDWLESLGFEFAKDCPIIHPEHVAYETPRTYYKKHKGPSILEVFRPLWNEQVKKGNIKCFTSHPMVEIEAEDDNYTKVIVFVKGKEKTFKGKHIVLTTGGYGSSPSYFKKKHPSTPLMSATYPTTIGDGQEVAERLGASFDYAQYHHPSIGGLQLFNGRCNAKEAWATVSSATNRQPRGIYINKEAKRFMQEDEENPHIREQIVAQQPDGKFWVIFDETALLDKSKKEKYTSVIRGWDAKKIKKAVAKGKFIWTAPTLSDLCKKIKLPQEQFQKTITNYNKKVKEGKDKDFNRVYLENEIRDAPFYAMEVHATVTATFGGIKVNDKFQILDKEGTAIAGLYGAGELLGLGATSGQVYCSGMAITPALSFGRMLGRILSE